MTNKVFIFLRTESRSFHRIQAHRGGSGSETGLFRCTKCTLTFDTAGGLSNHEKNNHWTLGPLLSCNVCFMLDVLSSNERYNMTVLTWPITAPRESTKTTVHALYEVKMSIHLHLRTAAFTLCVKFTVLSSHGFSELRPHTRRWYPQPTASYCTSPTEMHDQAETRQVPPGSSPAPYGQPDTLDLSRREFIDVYCMYCAKKIELMHPPTFVIVFYSRQLAWGCSYNFV